MSHNQKYFLKVEPGTVVGKWTALRRVDKPGAETWLWACECGCERERETYKMAHTRATGKRSSCVRCSASGRSERVLFRGELRTMREIAAMTGETAYQVTKRHKLGLPLDNGAEVGEATITYDGVTMTVADAMRRYGLSHNALLYRLERGVPLESSKKSAHTSLFDFNHWIADSCTNWVVSRHPDGLTLEEVGRLIGIVRERVRQVEWNALRKIKHAAETPGPKGDAAREFIELVRAKAELRKESYWDAIADNSALSMGSWTAKPNGRRRVA